jgi:polar amino acid transport system substrate-binding protein
MRKTADKGRRRFSRRAFLGPAVAVAICRLFAVDLFNVDPFAVNAAAARPLDEAQATGSIRIAVYRDFPPYSWNDGGVVRGIDADIAREIAASMGLKLDIMELTAGEAVSDDLRNAVWKGHYLGGGVADVMLHVPYDRQFSLRNPEAVILSPYQRERFALIRDPEKVDTGVIDNLPEVPIGVEIDSVPDFHLLGVGNGRLRSQLKHYMTADKAFDALWAGDVAAVMAPRTQVEAAQAARPAKGFVSAPVAVPPPMMSFWDIGFAVKENSRDLAVVVGDILAAMATDGRLEKIFKSYGATWEPIPLDD